MSKNSTSFFLNNLSSTWKTILQNTVINKLRSQQYVVLAVVSSGIAATLWEGGRIVHFWFKIFLNTKTNWRSGITKRSNLVNLFQYTELIFWDKAQMQTNYNFKVIKYIFQYICDIIAKFDKKIVCFCNNFRQILPLILQRS